MRPHQHRTAPLTGLLAALCLAACSAPGPVTDGRTPAQGRSNQATAQGTPAYDFSPFSEPSYEQVEVSDDPGKVTAFMPGLAVAGAHSMAASRENPRDAVPAPDPRYWWNAVVTLDQGSVDALTGHAGTDELATLPAVAPDLQANVPEGCTFVGVPVADATTITGASAEAADADSFTITGFALSTGCSTAIITADVVL